MNARSAGNLSVAIKEESARPKIAGGPLRSQQRWNLCALPSGRTGLVQDVVDLRLGDFSLATVGRCTREDAASCKEFAADPIRRFPG